MNREPFDSGEHAAVIAVLESLPLETSAPGWERGVWAAIEAEQLRARAPVARRWWAVGAALCAAAALAFAVWSHGATGVSTPGLAVRVIPHDDEVRGPGTARERDVLLLEALGRRQQIWAYRGDDLVAACPTGPGCIGGQLYIVLRPGVYRAFAVEGSAPAPTAGLDADRDAAEAAGAVVRTIYGPTDVY